MADTRKTEVVITCNTSQPQAAVRAMEKELKRLKTTYQQLSDAGKAGSEKAKKMAHDIKELSIAVKEGKDNLDRIVKVTNNLSGSSLTQLNRALRQVKKEMGRVSEDSDKLTDLRQKYKAISDQIKILQGDMINIKKHMGDLSSATDSWLSRAINQQKQLVASTQKTSSAYQGQVNILHQLQAEQARRAFSTISAGGASAESLRAARANLTSYRDQLGAGGIMPASGNVAKEIEAINAELKKCDEQLDAINGKEKQVEKTTNEIQQKADDIVLDPKRFSPKEIKSAINDIQKELDRLSMNDPAREQLGKSMKELQGILNGVDNELVNIGRLLQPGNLKKAPLETLQKAARQLETEMKQMNRDQDEYINKQKQLRQIRAEIERTTTAINSQASAWKTTFRNISMYFGVFQLFSIAQQKLQAILNDNLAYSDQMADVRKVTGLAADEVDRLAESIAKIDSRSSIQELTDLAYQGGKMGFGKYGVEGMTEFVRAADQVKVALSDDLGEDSLLQISKLTDTMGLIPKLGVERSMLSVGSSINQLSATSTASGTHIVDFAKRLTGLARITGITTPELLALGSAADALGQAPEVAATAFGKLFTSLQNNHNLIEKSLGMAKGSIGTLFEQGKAMEAILLILDKMREKGNMNALGNIWKDLGSDGQRLIGVMATMSKNVDTLRDHVEESNDAFIKATSLTNEYALKQDTANAILERANSLWEKAFVNPQGVDTVKSMTQQWYDLSAALTSSVLYMGQVKGSLYLIWITVKVGLALLPFLLQYLMFAGVYKAVSAVATGFVALRNAIIASTAAQQGLNKAMKANIFGIVASLVITLITYLTNYGDVVDDVADSTRSLKEYTDEAARAYDNERRKLDSFVAVLNDANTSTKERERILKRFSREYQPYLSKLGVEVKSVDDLRGAYEALNAEIKKKMYYQLRERAYTDKLGDAAGGVQDATLGYSKYINREGSDFQGFDTKWLQSQVDAGKNAQQIYRDIMEQVYGKGGVWSGYNGDYLINNQSKRDTGLRTRIESFLKANKNYNDTKKDIDDAFNPIIGDYDPFKGDDPGSLLNDAVDKEEQKKRKAEEAARRKALRAEMREENEKAKAIIDNVKNYYERQIAAITEMATNTGMSEEWQRNMTDGLTTRMNSALANVRQALAGTENEWAQFRQTMIEDLYEPLGTDGTNQSTQLLDNIIHNDVEKLKQMITVLSKELGQNGSVLLDQIWRKATENQLSNAKQENKAYQRRQQVLLEKNYTGKVNRDYENQMEQMGVADLSASQSQDMMMWSRDGDKDKIQAFVDQRSKMWQDAFVQARAKIVDVFASDVSKEEGQKAMLTLLFGPDYEEKLSGSALSSLLSMDLQQWQVFYQKLIEMSDAYTDAQKKAYDESKRRADFVFSNSSGIQQIDVTTTSMSDANSEIKRFDSDKNIGQQMGMSWNMDSDPEILRYRLLAERARLYFEEMKRLRDQDKISEEQLTSAKRQMMEAQSNMADKVAAKFQERVSLLQSFSEPMATFAEGVGEYLGNMIYDTEESNIKLKDLAREMLKSYVKMSIKLMAEDLTRRVTKQLYYRQEEADETMHQQTMLQIQQMYQAIMLSTQATSDAERLTQHSTSNATELSEEASATTGKVGLGIAGGAAKIIGTLGFWGIPLIAVISALLMGLLSWALSAAFGGSESGGSEAAAPNVKLATGMLTYDSGNVQSVASGGGTSPVLGSDGNVYQAQQVDKLGTGIVTRPISTMVNGQPALVGEKGPEIVIGRETSAAMMMNNPGLIGEIAKYDRNYSGRGLRMFDSGNVSEFTDGLTDGSGAPALSAEDVNGLRNAMDNFASVMLAIQKNGLHVNKYGRGGLAQESADGANFMRRNSGDVLWRRKS